MKFAILRERNPFYVLHNDVWSSVRQRIGVVKVRDAAMIELSQGFLLAGKTLPANRREPGIAQNLDGDLAPQIFAFGKVHDSHPAFAEYTQHVITTDFPAR